MTPNSRPPVTAEDPEPMARVLPAPTETIACRDYRAHQHHHRRAGNSWTCDACAAAPTRPQAAHVTPSGTPHTQTDRAGDSRQVERQSVTERRDLPDPHVHPTAFNPLASPGTDPVPVSVSGHTERTHLEGTEPPACRFVTSRSTAHPHAQIGRSEALPTSPGHRRGHGRP